MCKELISMINSDDISVERFFTMDPFSYINDRQYSKISKDVHFFDDLYVITSKTYERLAMLTKLATDSALSAIVITGYSGSGKTNFLKYCEAIIQKRVVVPDYALSQVEIENIYSISDSNRGSESNVPTFFDETQDEGNVNELSMIRKGFISSLHNIKRLLDRRYRNYSIEQVKSDVAGFINNKLKGNIVYFDFDADKQDSNIPLEIKLTRQIETHLYAIDTSVIENIYTFYKRNSEEFKKAFENRDSFYFEKAITFIYESRVRQYEEYKDKLLSYLSRLEIDQLMCIEVLLTISENLNAPSHMFFYFLDNIDLISGDDNTVLINTLSKFWDFLKEIQSFVHKIRQKDDLNNKNWIERYDSFKYVFSMRETTAMHIGDHLRNRISEFSRHFDISMDVNKSFILKKRFDLLNKYIATGEILNPSFISDAKNIERIIEDKYFKWNFFDLFNNDYRKAIDCLCAFCKQSGKSIKASLPLIEENNPYRKFGGRGVIIKTLCDSFKRWKYWQDLKVPMRSLASRNTPYNVTLIRIILTVLVNHQKELTVPEHSTFFVERENCISLRSLYEEVRVLCPEKQVFIKCIESMFSGRNWTFWNHLITFDNVLNYSRQAIKESLDGNGDNEIYVRCTKAGERYLSNLCVHYEFFACRYCTDNSKGLFAGKYNKKDCYNFEIQIKDVLEYVKKCCLELHQVNMELIKNGCLNQYDDLLYTQYVIDGQFHEERIIHNHITYLDAFRLYLIQGMLNDDIRKVNEKIIGFIEQYLELLKYDGKTFYSSNSEKLFNELTVCIKMIKDKSYNDTEIVISRTYYSKRIETAQLSVK